MQAQDEKCKILKKSSLDVFRGRFWNNTSIENKTTRDREKIFFMSIYLVWILHLNTKWCHLSLQIICRPHSRWQPLVWPWAGSVKWVMLGLVRSVVCCWCSLLHHGVMAATCSAWSPQISRVTQEERWHTAHCTMSSVSLQHPLLQHQGRIYTGNN